MSAAPTHSWHGRSGHGEAWRGPAWRGLAGDGRLAGTGVRALGRPRVDRHGMARRGEARQGEGGQQTSRCESSTLTRGKAGRVRLRPGMSGRVKARGGRAAHAEVRVLGSHAGRVGSGPSLARSGRAGRSGARLGEARRGYARQGKDNGRAAHIQVQVLDAHARLGWPRPGMSAPGSAGQSPARHGWRAAGSHSGSRPERPRLGKALAWLGFQQPQGKQPGTVRGTQWTSSSRSQESPRC